MNNIQRSTECSVCARQEIADISESISREINVFITMLIIINSVRKAKAKGKIQKRPKRFPLSHKT